MAKQKEILEEARLQGFAQPSAGMSVPEGYFDAVNDRIIASLPYRPEAEERPLPPRTIWQKVRPYVYMAAMFAGVWCMMKMFSSLTTKSELSPSPILAEALSNEIFVNDYIIDDMDERELMDQMMEDGFDLTSLDMQYDEDTPSTDEYTNF